MRILAALSGGVDSSVAALLLKNAGHEITGITMSVYREGVVETTGGNACYGADEKDDIEAAREFCRKIDIPYHVFDCSEEYEKIVLDYFKEEYRNGRTPNPCIRCNQLVKLGVLPKAAEKSGLDFDKIATGHYVNVNENEKSGRYYLTEAVDSKKDQSYFLYRLSQSQLSRLMFPLGKLTKAEVREIAREYSLASAESEESQDFISGDYKTLFKESGKTGNIIDTDGRILGIHQGLFNYTIGQRRGLGISAQHPLYVVKIDKSTNSVIVGNREELSGDTFGLADLSWMKLVEGQQNFDAMVKIRSAHNAVSAEITVNNDGTAIVHTHEAVNAATPGQSAVFYNNQGDILGGGVII